MKPAAACLALLAALALAQPAQAQAQEERLANYFICHLKEGKSLPDLLAFKASYEKAVEKAGLAGYELRVQLPLYWGQREDGVFVWEGSWKDFTAQEKIATWFRQSEWPAKFRATMSCKESSLWRVLE